MYSLSSLCSNMKCPPKDHLLNTLPLTGGSVLVSGGGNGRKYDIAGKITSQGTWLGKFHLFLSPFLSWIPSFLKRKSYWVAGFNSTFCPSTWSQQLWAESLWKLESKWILPPLFSEVIFFFCQSYAKRTNRLVGVLCMCVFLYHSLSRNNATVSLPHNLSFPLSPSLPLPLYPRLSLSLALFAPLFSPLITFRCTVNTATSDFKCHALMPSVFVRTD